MKKSILIMIIVCAWITGLFVQCGGPGRSQSFEKGKGEKSKAERGKGGGKEHRSKDGAGKIDPDKPDLDKVDLDKVDIDKLDIPERLKEGYKSGRISKERFKMILKRMQQGSDAPTVKIEPVERRDIKSFLVLNGAVEPERKVAVHSRLAAYVSEIRKEEGDFVRKGDVLAVLDDTEIRISHRQAEIQLKQAAVSLEDQEGKYKRSTELDKTDMIAEQEFHAVRTAYDNARLDHMAKQENFKELQLQLGYARITAPVSGYVTERLIEVGTRVNSNQQVYTVEDFSPLLVKVYVPTADIGNLQTGMAVEVSSDALAGRVFEGRIKLINPRIDMQSGTVKVTIEVTDENLHLKPGMFVGARIIIGNKVGALAVPQKSISYKQDTPHVFVFEKMKVFKRIIKTGITEGGYVEVLEGIGEGEQIVTVGVETLKDQMTVRPAR